MKCWVYRGTLAVRAAQERPRASEAGLTWRMMPKRVKYRKTQRGIVRGPGDARATPSRSATSACSRSQAGWIKANVLEAGRVAAVRGAPEGRVYIRVFPHKSVTSTPEETRMGTGKGEPDYWCAVVKPGTMLFEIGGGVTEDVARETLNKVAHKLPVAHAVRAAEGQAMKARDIRRREPTPTSQQEVVAAARARSSSSASTATARTRATAA